METDSGGSQSPPRAVELNVEVEVVTICGARFSSEDCIIPTECICVFQIIIIIDNDYYPIQHSLAGLSNEHTVLHVRYELSTDN
jgi:hypothetical protein